MCSRFTGQNNLEPPVLHLHHLLTPSLLLQQKALQDIPVDHLIPVDRLTLVGRPTLEVRLTLLHMESQVLEEEFRKHCLECARNMLPMCMK